MLIGGLSAIDIVTLLAVLIVSIVLHEFMHGFVAFKLGDTTAQEEGRLNFNPLNHIDPFMTIVLPITTLLLFHTPLLAAKPVPFNPHRLRFGDYGMALVAAAGPLTNLAIAIVTAALLYVTGNPAMVYVLSIFVELNVALAVFNLVPIPPLDGSRVLYSFAPDVVRSFFDQIEVYGFFLIFALILFGHFGDVLVRIDQMVLKLLV